MLFELTSIQSKAMIHVDPKNNGLERASTHFWMNPTIFSFISADDVTRNNFVKYNWKRQTSASALASNYIAPAFYIPNGYD